MALSWLLHDHSVNSGIDKDLYLGQPCKIIYPTIDILCEWVATLWKQHKKPIYGWKKDMSRAFKQVPLKLGSWGPWVFPGWVPYSLIRQL